jgi:TATA-box binding protein (TBP) (component of TFIID and TFIIIB)
MPFPDGRTEQKTTSILIYVGCSIHPWGIAIPSYVIQNIVASANLGIELDLSTLALGLSGAEYEPEQFQA